MITQSGGARERQPNDVKSDFRRFGEAAMRKFILSVAVLAAFEFAWALPTPAFAQATRTWVSGVGSDSNPCSRTQPCLTFAAAVTAAAAGGEVNCIDAGGFGSVIITKSISIICDPTEAGIQVSGLVNGITINAGGNDVVYLSGLDIQGNGAGLEGIKFNTGKALHIDKSKIRGFAGNGINFGPASGSASTALLVITDSVIADNPSPSATAGGIRIAPAAGFGAAVTLTNVHADRNLFGIRAEDRSKVSIDRSTFASNANNGILAVSSSGAATEINVTNSLITHNGINGIVTSGAAATIRIGNVSIFDNGTGINTSPGGTIIGTSPGTSRNAGNSTAGAPNGSPLVLQ